MGPVGRKIVGGLVLVEGSYHWRCGRGTVAEQPRATGRAMAHTMRTIVLVTGVQLWEGMLAAVWRGRIKVIGGFHVHA